MRTLSTERLLAGRSVFLCGSVPEPHRGFERVPDAAFVIEQAVVALARAVFAEGGRLVFGAHPSLSPLVASVAAEYFLPDLEPRRDDAAMRPTIIYQSEAFAEVLPNETWDMFRLGFADLIWTEAKGGEHYRKGEPASRKCPLSLTEMRTRMIVEQEPCAMVIVGGMDGVAEELVLFQKLVPGGPIYTARATGGAAANVPERMGNTAVLSLEREWTRGVKGIREQERIDDPREHAVPPYGAMMQWLAEEVGGSRARG